MARPKVYVQHLVACLNAAWDGPAALRTSRTLERVGYWYAVPPDAEFPFEGLEFWVYARLYRRNSVIGVRDFALEVFWHDSPAGVVQVGGRSLGSVRFSAQHSVVSAAWPVRPLVFPGEGLAERNRPWGTERTPLRSEFIRIERQP
jgi:hypothetical protein